MQAFWKPQPGPSTEAEFDIEGLEVFSIERNSDGETEFGYLRNGKEESWVVTVDDEQHREFVRRLTAKLKARQQAGAVKDVEPA